MTTHPRPPRLITEICMSRRERAHPITHYLRALARAVTTPGTKYDTNDLLAIHLALENCAGDVNRELLRQLRLHRWLSDIIDRSEDDR
jgi:hypothetical protein